MFLAGKHNSSRFFLARKRTAKEAGRAWAENAGKIRGLIIAPSGRTISGESRLAGSGILAGIFSAALRAGALFEGLALPDSGGLPAGWRTRTMSVRGVWMQANAQGPGSGRLEWLDVLKGLGIVAVVWGHSGSPYGYLMFFFHMPLFFWISGYLYKPRTGRPWLAHLAGKARHLLVPYLFYLGLVTLPLLALAVRAGRPALAAIDWPALVWGGSRLSGAYGTFWFVTCLFTVQAVYDLLQRRLRQGWLQGVVLAGFYLLAYWESRYHEGVFVPWNADVALYAIGFYALGHLFRAKQWLERPRSRKLVLLAASVYALVFSAAYAFHYVDFGLDLKHRQYYYLGTNLLTPLALTIVLAGLSELACRWRPVRLILSSLGQASMAVMYLHLGIGIVLRRYMTLTPLEFLLAGILLPWLWHQVSSRVPPLRLLALGQRREPVRAVRDKSGLNF